MHRIWLLVLTGLLAGVEGVSQAWHDQAAERNRGRQTVTTGTVRVIQDPQLETLLKRHVESNAGKEGMNGFRIQIYFGSGKTGREQANENKAKALSEFPELKVHILYQYSNYKVRVGDFRTRNDAYAWYYNVLKKFPNAYIVPDVIEFPKLN